MGDSNEAVAVLPFLYHKAGAGTNDVHVDIGLNLEGEIMHDVAPPSHATLGAMR